MKFILTRTSLTNRQSIKKPPCEESIQDDYVTKQGTYKNWTVELNTLEDLLNFVNKVGEKIIIEKWQTKEQYEIEIYDDLRE